MVLLGFSRRPKLTVPVQEVVLAGGFGKAYMSVFTRGEKFFELNNHLGNVMVTVNDKKLQHSTDGITVDYYNADVVSAQDYYPFGMEMPGRQYNATTGYRYGFNGKENDNETSWQDYGFRIYDRRDGRFLSVDPLSNSYPWYTPYSFAGNKPVKFIDLDGAEESKNWYDYDFGDFMSWLGDPSNPFEKDGFLNKAATSANRTFNPIYNSAALVIGEKSLGIPSSYAPMTRADAAFNLITQWMLMKYGSIATESNSSAQLEKQLKNVPMNVESKPATQQTALKLSNEEKQKVINWIKQESLETPSFKSARWAQPRFSNNFSRIGQEVLGVRTIDDAVVMLKNGTMKINALPIDYIIRNDEIYILNTRSSVALTKAGIDRSKWSWVDRTGKTEFEQRLNNQLQGSDGYTEVTNSSTGEIIKQ
jgi:RHS repeat-associated protein